MSSSGPWRPFAATAKFRSLSDASRTLTRSAGPAGSLQRRFRAEDHRRLRRQHAAIAVRQRDLAVLHLAGAAFAAQLTDRLDQQEQAVHAGMAIGQPAAIGVDGETALGGDASAADEGPAFALLAEAEILQEQNGVDREGVVELD